IHAFALKPKGASFELLAIHHLERSALRLEGESVDAAAGAAAAEIAQEEVVLVASREKTRAGMIRQAGRTVGDVGERRQQVRRGVGRLGVPEFLGVPGAE